ncbi:MAG TPA: hypothetical protein VMR95_00700 [Candidatus Binatia bacterium]|nr:hypothetical protein [Candidatus Binatia bacterium]
MDLLIAYAAALGCSICNGVSTVLQKVGADHESGIHSFDLTFLLRLFRNVPYSIGTSLALMAYVLSLVALRVLPLFLVQALIAASIMVTAFGERLFLHKKLSKKTYRALAIIIFGLVLLAISAISGRADTSNHGARLLVELLPLPIALIGLFFLYVRKTMAAGILAALAGLSFGNTSTIGRILVYPTPFWKVVENPLFACLVVSAILGQYLFSVSLQRASATQSNAVMIATQTLGPAACGLLLFGDRVRPGFELVVLLGTLLVIVGSALTAVEELPVATI